MESIVQILFPSKSAKSKPKLLQLRVLFFPHIEPVLPFSVPGRRGQKELGQLWAHTFPHSGSL